MAENDTKHWDSALEATDNSAAIVQEIARIIDEIGAQTHYARQHNPSKKYLAELAQLGIANYMPRKFGNTDVQAVIAAAKDNGKTVGGFNAYGEGDVTRMSASKLYTLLNS